MKKSNLVITQFLTMGILLATGTISLQSNHAIAGPDCDRKPDHPSCDGGGEEPPPPPEECNDEFPGFSYYVEGTRKTTDALYLASSDGCRSELIDSMPDWNRGHAFHMTADRSQGILLWTEDPGNENQDLIRRQDFTVDGDGNLSLDPRVTMLPLSGEVIPAEDQLSYHSMDVWGDATHDSLYLVVIRMQVPGGDPQNFDRKLVIYNLNDMTEQREIFQNAQAAGDWLCPNVPYPQYVPTCYSPQEVGFNQSGTRLYIDDDFDDNLGQRWDGVVRLNIDRVGELADWIISAPELVYTGADGVGGTLARPHADRYLLPFPEYIAISGFAEVGSILDTDFCAVEYSFYASGNSQPLPDPMPDCIVDETFFSPNLHGGGDSWQTPDAILSSTLSKRHHQIWRRYVDGPMAGTEEVLIERARTADTGY
jgi:hypothetical protein